MFLMLMLCLLTETGKGDVLALDTYEIYTRPLLAAAPDGQMVLADKENKRLLFFNPEGEKIAESGRAGKGPGEFEYIYKVVWDGMGGRFVTVDYNRSVYAYWHPDGRLDREVPRGLRLANPSFFGDTLVGGMDINGTKGSEPKVVRLVGEQEFVLWQRAPLEAIHGTHAKEKGMFIQVRFDWDPRLNYACDGTMAAVNYSDTPKVTLVRLADGKATTVFDAKFPTPPVTPEHVKKVIDEVDGPWRQMVANALTPPEHWPFLSELKLDDKGRVWTFGTRTEDDAPVAFQVFDAGGTRLGGGTLPEVPEAGLNDTYYLLLHDEAADSWSLTRRPVTW